MFVIYQDSLSQWRWRFVAANGRIMADSAEGYCSKSNAARALRRFRELAARASQRSAASQSSKESH